MGQLAPDAQIDGLVFERELEVIDDGIAIVADGIILSDVLADRLGAAGELAGEGADGGGIHREAEMVNESEQADGLGIWHWKFDLSRATEWGIEFRGGNLIF